MIYYSTLFGNKLVINSLINERFSPFLMLTIFFLFFQRPDGIELELLTEHHTHTHSAIHGAPSLHVPPLQMSPPAPLFLSAEGRTTHLELLRTRQHRNPRLPQRTRWHHGGSIVPATAQYSGFLLHFL